MRTFSNWRYGSEVERPFISIQDTKKMIKKFYTNGIMKSMGFEFNWETK